MAARYDTAVVGGGLSGMIAAYELAKAGERVVLYEKEKELGGFARSKGKTHDYTEHSWRSFGDFYTNLRSVTDELGRLFEPAMSAELAGCGCVEHDECKTSPVRRYIPFPRPQ